jgi:hypothetical protein
LRRSALLLAALLVACAPQPSACPEGATPDSANGACVPAVATSCPWHDTVRRTRLCVDRSVGVRVTGTCAEDRSCACEDVDYCAPTRVGRALAAVSRFRVPIALALVLALAALVVRRRRRP